MSSRGGLKPLSRQLAEYDGLGQAELVRRKQVSASELLEAAIERAMALDPVVNAISRPMFAEAREELRARRSSSGTLASLPFLVKDIFSNCRGVPTTAGSRLLVDAVASHDAELVRRYREAGLLIFGKTTTSEFGSLPTTEAALYGPTRNPWNLDCTAGGSSGGGAAAVAARIVPAAQGSDGAGSIRIPASCCGLVGLKPTRGRITLGPDLAEGLGGTMVVGAMTITVRDTAALLDATEGPMIGDPYWAAPPARPFLEAASRPPPRLRIAVTRHSITGTAIHNDCILAVDDAAALCQSLGHIVDEAAPDIDAETYTAYYKRHWQMSVTRSLRRIDRQSGGRAVEQAEPFNQYLFHEGMKVSAADYIIELEWLQQLGRQLARWQHEAGYDLWLTPTLGRPPVALGWFTPTGELAPAVIYDRFMDFLPFTPFANLSGQPAISLPLYRNGQNLPIGVHFAAPYGEEAILLSLSAQLEAARPWLAVRPPQSA